mgnify:CR=1 FL=1
MAVHDVILRLVNTESEVSVHVLNLIIIKLIPVVRTVVHAGSVLWYLCIYVLFATMSCIYMLKLK